MDQKTTESIEDFFTIEFNCKTVPSLFFRILVPWQRIFQGTLFGISFFLEYFDAKEQAWNLIDLEFQMWSSSNFKDNLKWWSGGLQNEYSEFEYDPNKSKI